MNRVIWNICRFNYWIRDRLIWMDRTRKREMIMLSNSIINKWYSDQIAVNYFGWICGSFNRLIYLINIIISLNEKNSIKHKETN